MWEVLARDHRPRLRRLDFKLDVKAQDDVFLPMRALIPGPASHIHDLEVDVRMSGGHYKDGLRYDIDGR